MVIPSGNPADIEGEAQSRPDAPPSRQELMAVVSNIHRAAEEAGVSKGTLTGVVRTLQYRGLVERHKHPNDGRLIDLRITADGKALMEELVPRFRGKRRSSPNLWGRLPRSRSQRCCPEWSGI